MYCKSIQLRHPLPCGPCPESFPLGLGVFSLRVSLEMPGTDTQIGVPIADSEESRSRTF